MIGKELDAWLAEEWRAENERFAAATCFVCGSTKHSQGLQSELSMTNDRRRFVCYVHRGHDQSTSDFDVALYLRDPQFRDSRESQRQQYAELKAERRWRLINVPDWLLTDAPPPEQMKLFESEGKR